MSPIEWFIAAIGIAAMLTSFCLRVQEERPLRFKVMKDICDRNRSYRW
jgi:hypothetical protein